MQWEGHSRQKSTDALFSFFQPRGNRPAEPLDARAGPARARDENRRPRSRAPAVNFLRGQPSGGPLRRASSISCALLTTDYTSMHSSRSRRSHQLPTKVRTSIAGLSGDRIGADLANPAVASGHRGGCLPRSSRGKRDAFRAQFARHAGSLRRAYTASALCASAPSRRPRHDPERRKSAYHLVLNVAHQKIDGSDPFLDYATWASINGPLPKTLERGHCQRRLENGRSREAAWNTDSMPSIPPPRPATALAKILSDEKTRLHQGARGSTLIGPRGVVRTNWPKLFEALILFYGPDLLSRPRRFQGKRLPNLSEADCAGASSTPCSPLHVIAAVRPRGANSSSRNSPKAAPEKLRPRPAPARPDSGRRKDAPAFPRGTVQRTRRRKARCASPRFAGLAGAPSAAVEAVTTLTNLCAPRAVVWHPPCRPRVRSARAQVLSAAMAQVQPVMHDAPNEGEALPRLAAIC